MVVLTSSQEEQDIIESYELGVNSYLVKPVDFDMFILCVSELGFYWLVRNEPSRSGKTDRRDEWLLTDGI